MKHADVPLCLLQTFLRVRANRHTRLNGRLMHVCGLTVVFHCCWLRLSLRESSVTSAVLNGFEFFLKSKEWEFPLFTLMRPVMCFVHHHPPPPSPVVQISPFFPPHLHRPSAHTSRGAINLWTLTSWYVNSRWPLLVQVLRQICPITPPQRRSPPRLHTSW